jgi:4-diphosphocytidyl-2-C-methyl-D-erythritol kinase
MTRGEFFWAFGGQDEGLATPEVFARFDELSLPQGAAHPTLDDDHALMQALRAGDAPALGAALHNDLQNAALSLRPRLAQVLQIARDAGALGAIVSGSGPTVAAVASSRRHARAIAALWTAEDVVDHVWTATGPAPGARVTSGG